MKKFITMFLCALTSLSSVDADNKKIEHVSWGAIIRADDLRKYLHKNWPNLKTHFYYFDSSQIFALYEDPKKTEYNLLMIFRPDWSFDSIECKVNGEDKIFTHRTYEILVSHTDPESGDLSKETVKVPLGVWLQVQEEDIIDFKVSLKRQSKKWILKAQRNKAGKWTGSMESLNIEQDAAPNR